MDRYLNTFRIETTRLSNWNYSAAGRYFATICTRDRKPWFGKIENGTVKRTEVGEIAYRILFGIQQRFQTASIDQGIVMPDHIHAIIELHNNGDKPGRDAINRVSTHGNTRLGGGITHQNNPMLLCRSLSYIIRWYKGRTTFEIRKIQPKFAWQARFYDRIIRDENDLRSIRRYIAENPKRKH